MDDLVIRQCKKEDLPLLEKYIPTARYHINRFESQEKGDCLYLIAWVEGVPVGHLNLKLKGTDEEYVRNSLGVFPEFNAIGTYPPEMRSKGVGRALIEKAEKVCKELGFKEIGLAVDTENTRAELLYRRMGFNDSGVGEFDSVWWDTKEDGAQEKNVDHCIYLVKKIR